LFTNRVRRSSALVAACLFGAGLLVAAPAAWASAPAATAASTPGYDCVVETPYAGSPAAFQPLRVCASFDKAGYSSGDVVKLTVSATNIGTGTAPGVLMRQGDTSGSDQWTGTPVGALITDGVGEDLPAGDTVVSEVDGYAADPAAGVVTFTAHVYQFQPNGAGSTFGDPVSISSSVTPATGDYRGLVFADGNGNGQPDTGEGLAGAQLTLTGPYDGINGNPAQTYQTASDAQGDFQLSGLPAGHYSVDASGPSGWFVRPGPDGQATVDSSGGTSRVLFPATPSPFPLQASLSFDKTGYQAGDTAQITINLTNTSGSDLHGIQSQCNPPGDGDGMWGKGAGWEVLQAPGLTVPADQTTTLHLSEIVPANAVGSPAGQVVLDCVFGPNPGYELTGVAEAHDSATVSAPANPVDFTLDMVDDNPLDGPVSFSPDLLDPASQDPVLTWAGQVSNLPAGSYDIDIAGAAGGWSLAPGQSNVLNTADISDGQTVDVHVVRTTTIAPPSAPLAAALSVDQENPENPLQAEASGLASSDGQSIDSYSFDFGDGTPATTNATGTAGHTYATAGTYTVTLTDTDASGNTASTTQQVVIGSPFVPLSPVRLLDTRSGTGAPRAAIGPGGQLSLTVTGGPADIPAGGLTAVVLNVTVANATAGSFLTVYPDGGSRPATSNLNYTAGQTIPNLVTVPVGTDGKVNFYNHSGNVDVIADVEGYYRTAANPESGHQYQAGYLVGQAPHRLLDTRNGTGAPIAPLTGGTPLNVNVLSGSGVPQGAPVRAVVLNVTVTNPSGGSYLVVYPDGSAASGASNLNFAPGQTISNSVIVPVPADGGIEFLNHSGTTDVVADVQGYYTGGAGGAFVPVAPTRLLDTRTGGGALATGGTRTLPVAGTPGVPDDASAAVLNTTVTDGTANGYLTVYPDGSALPTVSDINFDAGETIPNMVTAGIGPDGKVDFYNRFGSVDVLADLFGYFTRS
jgi:PKD repeat protein